MSATQHLCVDNAFGDRMIDPWFLTVPSAKCAVGGFNP